MPRNCLSVFDHFVKLALKGLTTFDLEIFRKKSLSVVFFKLLNTFLGPTEVFTILFGPLTGVMKKNVLRRF